MPPQLVTAAPLNARNSHHVRLYRKDGEELTDEIGLILCNNEAEENFKAIQIAHTPQESLKTSSGATEHSDFEPPYSSLELDDWSMGRGYPDNSKQKNGYLDGSQIYTLKENVLFPCGDAEPGWFDTTYAKVDYRLDKTAHDDPVLLGGSLRIDLDPPPFTFGSLFVADDDYTNMTQFHMKLRVRSNYFDPDETMPDLELKIWEAKADDHPNLPAWSNCKIPDSGNLITTMTMPALDGTDVNPGALNMVVWTVVTPFDLDNAQEYFVTLTPTFDNGDTPNRWQVPTYSGNPAQYAQIVTRAGANFPWMQYKNTCNYRRSWQFYIDSGTTIAFDHRNIGTPVWVRDLSFPAYQIRAYASQFKTSSAVSDINALVISMHWEGNDYQDLDMRAIVYEPKAYDPSPCTVPDPANIVAELTYNGDPPLGVEGDVEVIFDVDGGGSFNLAADHTYFVAILSHLDPGTHSLDEEWTLPEWTGGSADDSNTAQSWDLGATWIVVQQPTCADDYQWKFYFAKDYTKFDHELTSGYGGEDIDFDKYLSLDLWGYPTTYRYGLGTIFKAKADYNNCIDFHMAMMPDIADPTDDMPPLQIQIWEVTTGGSPTCKIPSGTKISEPMTMTPESLFGLQTGIYKEIIWEVPKDVSEVPIDFDLEEGVEYFVTILPDSTAVEYREPNTWILDHYNANEADPAPMVWKEVIGDSWTQFDNTNCETNRKMWKFFITGEPQDFKAHFVELNGCLHVGLEFLDGTAGDIYRNGELGQGTFQTYVPADKINGKFQLDTDITEPVGDIADYTNQIMRITEGPGSETMKDWARIESVTLGTPTILYPTHRFNTKIQTYTARSKYVIQNSKQFNKVSLTPAIDQPITDMLGAMGAMYVCFGEKDNVYRFRYEYATTTPWAVTVEWVDEQYWADKMCQQVRAGNNYIWRIRKRLSQIVPANAVNLRDPAIDYVLDFDPAKEIFVGNTEHIINSWAIYGDDPHLWILKEDKPYEIVGEDVYEFRNSAMANMVDSRNGYAALQHDTYLFFSFHDGVQRWHYNGDLLSHGPEIVGPAGLPQNRQGYFAEFVSYYDTLIGAYDAGEDGYSAIFAWNGMGWTELYRAHKIGDRIMSCYIQSIDGPPVDWLWFSMGSTIMRMPIDTNPLGLINDDYYFYKFTERSHFDSSWISLGMKDVQKYVNKFKIIATKAPSLYDLPWEAVVPVPPTEPEYDEDGELLEGIAFAWRTDVSEGFTYYLDDNGKKVLQIGEFDINAPIEAEAQLIQYRVETRLAQNRYPIVITDIVMDSIMRLPHKTEIRIQFRLRDNDLDLLDRPDPYPTVKEKYDLLNEYADQAAPVWAQIDAKFVGERQFFIDQGSLQVVEKLRDHNIETWVMTLVLKEA